LLPAANSGCSYIFDKEKRDPGSGCIRRKISSGLQNLFESKLGDHIGEGLNA